ncbi:MAG TPA: SCO family protein, partial [Chthonomonadales bacterium]|nr:SCO family protein [Chthonomonadales bacterium]
MNSRKSNAMFRKAAFAVVVIASTLWAGMGAGAQGTFSTIDLKTQVGLSSRLNNKIPLDDIFRDENGKLITLGQYFGQKPVILIMPFYKCPGICTLEMDGLLQTVKSKELGLKLAKDYQIVTVSINPKETPEIAMAKKQDYMSLLGHPDEDAGWHFLTGAVGSIHELAQAVGFRYLYDP